MNQLYLPKTTKSIDAIINLPGSKSIANRVLPLAAFANGKSIIHNVPDVGEDVHLMLEALKSLGVKITKLATADNKCSSYEIIGCGGELPNKQAELFLGNSGTSIRFLTAMLALCDGEYTLTGIQRMKERPIGDLTDALRNLGCEINFIENIGYPPIKTNKFIDKIIPEVSISGKVSSQYLTGMLMALPLLKREVVIKITDELISRPYVDITLALLDKFSVKTAEISPNVFKVFANQQYQAIEYTVEPDASSASYFLAIAALNGKVQINNLSESSLQGDKNFAKVLSMMGARVNYGGSFITCESSSRLNGISVNMEDMPDVAMTIAAIAPFADSKTYISGISSWKVKETDRLMAIYTELTKLGVQVKYTSDSITIYPCENMASQVCIDTYNDHRMAMCFSLIALYNGIVINNPECVGKTFANYFELFRESLYK
ncbi:MAG: 3-phosphoshikimate 1-carboxyvinyltransferase [Neisseriaceae bacterium]|nr:MAG: 3-phosphoshikimate 1-carboxyvinyltransferase [Neisseriaceae bacterium]